MRRRSQAEVCHPQHPTDDKIQRRSTSTGRHLEKQSGALGKLQLSVSWLEESEEVPECSDATQNNVIGMRFLLGIRPPALQMLHKDVSIYKAVDGMYLVVIYGHDRVHVGLGQNLDDAAR